MIHALQKTGINLTDLNFFEGHVSKKLFPVLQDKFNNTSYLVTNPI